MSRERLQGQSKPGPGQRPDEDSHNAPMTVVDVRARL